MKPEILLLDEPLAALDALTRSKLQGEIERIRAHERKTIVMITNDVDEALLLADRIAVLEPNDTLGRVFPVTIERPRDRTALNHDEDYKAIRGKIAGYLGELNRQRSAQAADDTGELPNVQPISLLAPPKAYKDAIDRKSTRLNYSH